VGKRLRQLFKLNQKGDPQGRASKPNLADHATETKRVSVTSRPYRVAASQSTGQERIKNEDTLFILNSFLGGMDTPVAFGIFLVADGMGGHQSGELASNLAAQGISQSLIEHVYHRSIFERKAFSETDLKQSVQQAVEEAQALVLQRVPGGGTTLTFVMAVGDELYMAHVGDSRLYQVDRDGLMTLKTRDHSLVKRLVDLGEISENEADLHPHRNVLYRALGQTDPFEPDTDILHLIPGECLLICSDGLWGVLSEQKMTEILNQGDDLDQKAANLVQAANDAGGPDNISVILIERIE
jgi:PPM family protein phosphatase